MWSNGGFGPPGAVSPGDGRAFDETITEVGPYDDGRECVMTRRGKHYSRKRRSILGRVIGLVLLVVLVYTVVLVVSGFVIFQQYQKADAAFDRCEENLRSLKIAEAHTDAEEAAGYLAIINGEFKRPQWEIARGLPVIGVDARILSDICDIAGDLVDGAYLPVLDAAGDVTEGIGGLNILGTITAAPGAVAALRDAADIVSDCDARAAALPEAHLDFVNDATEELRRQTSQSADLLSSVDSALDVADVVKGIIM